MTAIVLIAELPSVGKNAHCKIGINDGQYIEYADIIGGLSPSISGQKRSRACGQLDINRTPHKHSFGGPQSWVTIDATSGAPYIESTNSDQLHLCYVRTQSSVVA